MNEARVFRKTQAGQAEVTARSGSLSLAMRRVLILIDGRRPMSEMAPMVRPGEIDGMIAALLEKGYIEPVIAAPAPVPAPAPGAAGPTTVSGPSTVSGPRTVAPTITQGPRTLSDVSDPGRFMSIDEAKRRVVRELTDRLGPEAEYIAIKIEQCGTLEELRARIRDAERVLTTAMGEKVAQDFVRALRRR